MKHITAIVIICLFLSSILVAQEIKPVQLPKPDTTGGKPLMQVLKARQSTREFSTDTLSLPVLSNLLWAACGINREESGKRTAPSAMNKQEIDVYIATAKGLFLYEPKSHSLQIILPDDIREKTGMQPFVKDVPVNLVYVADMSKATYQSENDKILYTAADAGFISQNVYLFCASEGLGTVVRGYVDRPVLEKIMNLKPEQKIILVQSVGYPKK
jgi:SagB-type dehydrogenase family enzyme